jgi:phage terminase large subunit GpA-like protein
MLAVTEPGIKKITVMGPTQILKTELINNIVGYFMHQDPSPVIVMQPIEKLAKTWSTTRLDPMLQSTPVLRDLVRNKRERDSGNTESMKTFPGGFIAIVSAGSPSDVASRPVRIVLMDEVDKYKTAGHEGDPEKLIEQRSETFWNALSVAVCSPTNEGTSKIAARFEDSDQRFFHAECPHCLQLEKLEWLNVKWSNGDPETAHYECSKCSEPWTEVERLKAVANGEYVATKPFKGHAGFHCNAIASPWQPLSNLVRKFLEAGKDPEKLKVFVNTSLAETWKPAVEVPDWERLYDRRETYPIATLPSAAIKFLTCGIDVQGDRLEAQVVGWTRDKQAYVIDYHVIHGQTHLDETWQELFNFIQEKSYDGGGRRLFISFACVDSGFNTQKVYEFVSRFSPNKVRATKGSDSLRTFYKIGSDLISKLDGSRNRFAHKLWMVGSSFMKEGVYANFKLPSPIDGVAASGYIHTPEFDQEYFKQLCSESLVRTKKGWEWQKNRERNEGLDTLVYARAAAAMFGLDRFTQNDWETLDGLALDLDDVGEEELNGAQSPTSIPANPAQTSASAAQSRPANAPKSPGLWRNQGLRRRA